MDYAFIRPEVTPRYDPRGVHPHDIPSPGVFDEPTVKVCLNTKWASHLTAGIERFIYEDAWRGTEEEIYAAIDAVIKVLAEFDKAENQGVCNVPSGLIIGEVRMFGMATLPDNWLECDGAEVLRADYQNLFDVIGETYGAGNGTTTFLLPDFKGRMPVGEGTGYGIFDKLLGEKYGADLHTITVAEMPAHNHPITHRQTGGSLGGYTAQGTGYQSPQAVAINLGSQNTGGGASINITNPQLTVAFAIYAGVP